MKNDQSFRPLTLIGTFFPGMLKQLEEHIFKLLGFISKKLTYDNISEENLDQNLFLISLELEIRMKLNINFSFTF